MTKRLADAYSMDIPHVAAVELPLAVKNPEKAIEMIGGREKIKAVINSNNKSINDASTDPKVLELRLRNDPFHHPIQSVQSNREKVLLKVTIPKQNLPEDFDQRKDEYDVRDLIRINAEKGGRKHQIKPVAIINNTYSFKAMTDFQISTKNNQLVNDFNDKVMKNVNFNQLKSYFEEDSKFLNNPDFKNRDNYANRDHQLPPPPLLSHIKYPFDYKYEKNPISVTIMDPKSGVLKVVSKKDTVKLYTLIIDFHANVIPTKPSVELTQNLEQLSKQTLQQHSTNYDLLKCIEWLEGIFDIKPIWLRKHLEDIVPQPYKRVIKQALPYVSYIFKNGPWRFCNVKLGVNPKEAKEFWVYQSEYFRIPNLTIKKAAPAGRQVLPNTIKAIKNKSFEPRDLKVSESLIFSGLQAPRTVTFQIGDITDEDITTMIEESIANGTLFRGQLDFQDGWINKQIIETIRRLTRYKLTQLVKEEKFEPDRINKIKGSSYEQEDEKMQEADEEENEDDDDDDVEEELAEDEDEDEEVAVEVQNSENQETLADPTLLQSEQDVLSQLAAYDEVAAAKLQDIVGFVRQDAII